MRWIHTPADRGLVESLVGGMRSDPALRGVGSERTARSLAPLLMRRGICDAESARDSFRLRSLTCMRPN